MTDPHVPTLYKSKCVLLAQGERRPLAFENPRGGFITRCGGADKARLPGNHEPIRLEWRLKGDFERSYGCSEENDGRGQ